MNPITAAAIHSTVATISAWPRASRADNAHQGRRVPRGPVIFSVTAFLRDFNGSSRKCYRRSSERAVLCAPSASIRRRTRNPLLYPNLGVIPLQILVERALVRRWLPVGREPAPQVFPFHERIPEDIRRSPAWTPATRIASSNWSAVLMWYIRMLYLVGFLTFARK